MNIVKYSVKTVDDSFTWRRHERYTMMVEN